MRFQGEFLILGVVIVVCGSASARGATVWNEQVQGDLSGDRLNPTQLVLLPGDNDLIARTQGGDLEYVRITVPTGGQLTALAVRSYQGFDNVAFIGVQQGSTFTVGQSASPDDLYGYTHFGSGAGNILDDMGNGFGAQGFTPPLGPGNYTFWIQQLGGQTDYTLNFALTVIPEPSALALVGGAVAYLARPARRRR